MPSFSGVAKNVNSFPFLSHPSFSLLFPHLPLPLPFSPKFSCIAKNCELGEEENGSPCLLFCFPYPSLCLLFLTPFSPSSPSPPFPFSPLLPHHRSRTPKIQLESGGVLWDPSVGVWCGAEPQPKSNLVHYSFEMWDPLATILILIIFLRINWPSWQICCSLNVGWCLAQHAMPPPSFKGNRFTKWHEILPHKTRDSTISCGENMLRVSISDPGAWICTMTCQTDRIVITSMQS